MTDILTAGLTELGLDTAAAAVLERYADALLEKNKVMNLTAITQPDQVATLHLLACAPLLPLAPLRCTPCPTASTFSQRAAMTCPCPTSPASTPGRRTSPRSTGSGTMWPCPVPWPS